MVIRHLGQVPWLGDATKHHTCLELVGILLSRSHRQVFPALKVLWTSSLRSLSYIFKFNRIHYELPGFSFELESQVDLRSQEFST